MKKLTSLLALTAVVANLGIATVFAASTTAGTQTITCNDVNGAQTFAVTTQASPDANTVAFEARTTDFYNTTNAPLITGASAQWVKLSVSDTRGYDPSASDCGVGNGYTVQSDGLYLGGNNAAQNLGLRIGQALDAAHFAWAAGTHAPVALADVFSAPVVAASANISTPVEVTRTSEAFLGTVDMTFSGADLEVIKPAAPIQQGNYSGTITFSQVA